MQGLYGNIRRRAASNTDVSIGARAFVAIVGVLVASGILATVARSDSCAVTVRWNDSVYTHAQARFAVLKPGGSLSEATIPDCTAGGRCAPSEETMAAFAISGVPPEAAVLVPDYYNGLFVAAGTFPQLPDHPLHEALYGLPNRPDYRRQCEPAFALEGTVNHVDPLRIDVESSEVELSEEEEGAWLEVDSGTRIEGFDREGIATLEPGDEILARAQLCVGHGEPGGPVAVSIERRR
jgi:hypothetical protein